MSGGARPGAARRGAGSGYILWVTTLTQAALAWVVFIFPPIAVVVAASLDVDPVYVGYQVGLVFTLTISATLYSGWIIARIGMVGSMRLALTVALAGIALCTLQTVAAIAAASVLFGFSNSLANPSTAMVLRSYFTGRHKAFVFSFKQTSVPAGVIMSSLCGTLIAGSYGWIWALLPTAVALAALLAALQRLAEPPRESAAGPGFLLAPFNAFAALGRNRPLLLLALGGFAFGMCQGVVMSFTSNLFAHELGRGLRYAGNIFMLTLAGAICGRLFWGHLADRLANPVLVLRVTGATIVASSLAVGLLPAAAATYVWVAVCFAVGFSAVGWNGLLIAEMYAHSFGRAAAQQMAGGFFFMMAGGALSPLLFPFVYAALGSYATAIAAFSVCFGLVAMLCVRHTGDVPERHRPPTPIEPEV